MYLIDTHAHLNDAKFKPDLEDVIARAEAAGVRRTICCGYDIQSSRIAVQIARRFDAVYATVGIHPHDAKNYDALATAELMELSADEKVLAIGEIGLDFHYNFSPREQQFAAFEAQLRIADEVGLPIVVHSRESNKEVLQVLEAAAENIVGCVFHFFSGDEDFARRVLDNGFYLGFDGPLTFKKAEGMRAVAKMCPLDRILIETDCPYLAPIPHRGKRNEPAYVRLVAEEIARLRGISLDEVATATTANAGVLFGKRLIGD